MDQKPLQPRRDDVVSFEFPNGNKGKTISIGYVLNEEGDPLKIIWYPSENVEQSKAVTNNALKILDRFFYPGDFVRRITDERIGYVQSVTKTAAVRMMTGDCGNVIVNVPTTALKSPKIFLKGDIILYEDQWLGEVLHVRRQINLLYRPNDGNHESSEKKNCWILWDDLENFLGSKKDAFGRHSAFYEGLQLVNRQWKEIPDSPIRHMSREEFLKARISKIWVEEMEVRWIKNVKPGWGDPPEKVLNKLDSKIKGIRRLVPGEELMVHLGSIRVLEVTDENVAVQKAIYEQYFSNPEKYIEKNIVDYLLKNEKAITKCVEVIATNSLVNVVWLEDGKETVLKSTDGLVDYFLGPSFHPGLHVKNVEPNNSTGIIQSVNFADQTVTLSLSFSITGKLDEKSLYDMTEDHTLAPETIVVIAIDDVKNWDTQERLLGYVMHTNSDGTITIKTDSFKTVVLKDANSIVHIYYNSERNNN